MRIHWAKVDASKTLSIAPGPWKLLREAAGKWWQQNSLSPAGGGDAGWVCPPACLVEKETVTPGVADFVGWWVCSSKCLPTFSRLRVLSRFIVRWLLSVAWTIELPGAWPVGESQNYFLILHTSYFTTGGWSQLVFSPSALWSIISLS